jgi:hypothetical protein
VNSRAAILKPSLQAIEIRVIDTQEHPYMDLCLTMLVTAAVEDIYHHLSFDHVLSSAERRDRLEERKKLFLQSFLMDQKNFSLTSHYLLYEQDMISHLTGGDSRDMKSGLDFWRLAWIHRLQKKVDQVWHHGIEIILEDGSLASRLYRVLGASPSHEFLRETYQSLQSALNEIKFTYKG